MIMRRHYSPFIVLSLALMTLSTSCGKSDDDDDQAAAQTGVLKTSLLASTDVRSTPLTSATCVYDRQSGFFSGAFTGPSGEALDVKVKGFSTTPKTYTCKQPQTNQDGDLGDNFDECGIEFAIPDGTLGPNTYSSYRTVATQDTFIYGGACSVATIYTAPKIMLNITCANLIQTKYHGAARNPISGAETATLASGTTVECTI